MTSCMRRWGGLIVQVQMLIDQLNTRYKNVNEDAGKGIYRCPSSYVTCCRRVYDAGAPPLSLPAPFSSSCSCSYLISASSASLPACVSVGIPLWISFSKYL